MMKKLLLLISLIISSYLLHAQQIFTVRVTDLKTGNVLSNATVTNKSTYDATSSDGNGLIKVTAHVNDDLEVSCVGYRTRIVKVTGTPEINVPLEALAIDLGDVVVIGSRSGARAKLETAVPVDVIRVNQAGLPTAKMDLTSVLNVAAPSFNYNKQSGADGADHVDLGTLRGLGPDQTLVLINGKRRHQTAFVTLFGTRGRGNSGADLNAFPEAAVDRIEILRDGASAQYGSDAMAGVINIILKKDINQWSVNAGWSGFYDNKYNSKKFSGGNQYVSGNKIDGQTVSFSANNGFKLGNNGGFINLSFDYLYQGKTYRQADTSDWASDKNALPYINPYRRAFGDGSVETYGAMYNLEVPTSASGKTVIYSFGGYNHKGSDAFAYTRNWSGRPERFPVTAAGDLIFDPSIMQVTNDGEIYYNPHIQTHISDFSIAAGIKGTCHQWTWDLSNTTGRNNFHFFGDKTYNASAFMTPGTPIPTHFDDGGSNFLQNTTNLDFSKAFKTVASGLNLGLGAEFRFEQYKIYKGEEASYSRYADSLFYPNVGETRKVARGSQGFPGFSPIDVIDAQRSDIAVYADAELNATNAWLMDAAVRYENYSDFGSVATFKFATRYKILKNLNLRGSVSTGYRAPSLQQINFSNTLTSFYGGVLVESRVANNNDPITKSLGIPKLKEEKSVNYSVGFSWKPINGLTFTADGYMVKVKDRIVLSGLFNKFDATLPTAFTTALENLDVTTAQFFANAVNTSNYGLDLVLDYSKKIGKNTLKALLAGNIQHMTIDDIHIPAALDKNQLNRKSFFSDREEEFLKASAPNQKFSLSLEYNAGKIGFGTHLTYFGKMKLLGFGSTTAENPYGTGINPVVPSDADGSVNVPEVFNYKGKLTTDVFASYRFCKKISLYVGVDNVFNVHPDLSVNPQAKGWFGDNESGGPWDSVQMGFNGLRMFGKLALNF